jgi:hypothetical protein
VKTLRLIRALGTEETGITEIARRKKPNPRQCNRLTGETPDDSGQNVVRTVLAGYRCGK